MDLGSGRAVAHLKLRAGVVFHDGEPLDAEAVRFNFERNKTAPYSRRVTELKPVKTVTVLDPLTVQLELSEPNAPLMAQLADRAGMMVSPKAARELGDRMAKAPVCAGPYRFVEWVPQDRIVFEKFDRYWNRAAVAIDRAAYLPIPDDTVRLSNLRAGTFQLTERIAPSDLPTVRGDARLKLYESASLGYRVLSINAARGEGAKAPLGTSAKLREAFELSLDRAIINQVAFDGAFIPTNQPEAPGTAYYAAGLSGYGARPCAREGAGCRKRTAAPIRQLADRLRPARPACRAGHPGDGGRGRLRREDHRERGRDPAQPHQQG